MFLIFDTETTGLPRDYKAPLTDFDNWPRMVQIAWQIHDFDGQLIDAKNFIVKPEGFTIPYNAEKLHGISTEMALEKGEGLHFVLSEFAKAVSDSEFIIGHNIEFDINIAGSEFLRNDFENILSDKKVVDIMREATNFCALPGGRGGKYKYPKLTELHLKLFGKDFEEAHNASADVVATARCFLELLRIGLIGEKQLKLKKEIIDNFKKLHPDPVEPAEIEVESHFDNKKDIRDIGKTEPDTDDKSHVKDYTFSHLHTHSYYSVLQAQPSVEALTAKAAKLKMPALALTDRGNLFGAYAFINAAKKNNIKPIVGCEYYLVKDRKKQKFTKDNPDRRYYQVLLAKNLQGYRNLSKLSSLAYIEGSYGLYPRIDKEILVEHKEGLIATTGGLKSEICDLILNIGDHQAEEVFKWWHEQFGDDFYIQLNRHELEEENRVNKVLLEFSKKYNVKVFAANNVYYIEKEDSDLHDSLLCIQNGEYQSTPIGFGRDKRFGFPNNEFYFKSAEEMQNLFYDIPEAITNIPEIVEKVETYSLNREPLMPHFPIPEKYADPDDYLRHLTFGGAKNRYPEITDALKERINFELSVIKKMGYPGYFLIVQDFLNEARKMGVWVGPGRGSAAGSVVAYCLKITDIDPLKFDLLFERFLNPDRISLPDIDIDFDEDGREKVLKWIVDKYGAGRVAHIITFGKMAPKMAIRDIARVKQLPLQEANRLAKLVPGTPGTTFKTAYKAVPELINEKKSKNPLIENTLASAEKLEGTVRNIGTHACGIIIGKEDLIDHIPLSTSKDSELLITQFEGAHIENVGMLKMDLLGLKTLSIIKDTIENIKKSKGKNIDIDDIPFDDEDTFKLFSRGDTTGIFQFESDGMKNNLRELKPNRFEDLIAMNALYRPGPMEYIPSYIRRKHGKEKIEYDIPEMEEILKETYGITVYQEQVMLLSQKLANFTKGQADSLRKGMGKKKKEIIDDLKPKFFDGAKKNMHKSWKIEKIWKDWGKFTRYGFNKSHSACYAYVSYRMAYLKAHFPAEFIAAVLSRNLNDISKITFFIDDAKRTGLKVLKPDVNESDLFFIVNKNGEIRFGMAAIKGLGELAAATIIEERIKNGIFNSIFNFSKRINMRIVNKRSFEALAMAGAFDSFENTHRAQFFFRENSDDSIFMEKVMKFGSKYQERKNSAQFSLFDDLDEVEMPDPSMPQCQPWSNIEQLKNEKNVTGFYISGHPLNDYKLELKNFCSHKISDFKDNLKAFKNRQITFGGMVVAAGQRTTQNNNPYGYMVLEDYDDSFQISLFSEDYLKFKHFLTEGFFLLIRGKVQKRYRSEDQYEIKVNDIMLLPEVIEKRTKLIKLKIAIDNLDDNLLANLQENIKKHKGKCPLRFLVYDPYEKLQTNLKSEKVKVNPGEFLKLIDRIPEVDYELSG